MLKNSTRFERKLDAFFWFLVSFLPLILYVVNIYNGNSLDFFTFVSDNFTFDFVNDIFVNVLNTSFGSVSPITSLLSYFASVELLHILFDALVLVPRLGKKLLGRLVD